MDDRLAAGAYGSGRLEPARAAVRRLIDFWRGDGGGAAAFADDLVDSALKAGDYSVARSLDVVALEQEAAQADTAGPAWATSLRERLVARRVAWDPAGYLILLSQLARNRDIVPENSPALRFVLFELSTRLHETGERNFSAELRHRAASLPLPEAARELLSITEPVQLKITLELDEWAADTGVRAELYRYAFDTALIAPGAKAATVINYARNAVDALLAIDASGSEAMQLASRALQHLVQFEALGLENADVFRSAAEMATSFYAADRSVNGKLLRRMAAVAEASWAAHLLEAAMRTGSTTATSLKAVAEASEQLYRAEEPGLSLGVFARLHVSLAEKSTASGAQNITSLMGDFFLELTRALERVGFPLTQAESRHRVGLSLADALPGVHYCDAVRQIVAQQVVKEPDRLGRGVRDALQRILQTPCPVIATSDDEDMGDWSTEVSRLDALAADHPAIPGTDPRAITQRINDAKDAHRSGDTRGARVLL